MISSHSLSKDKSTKGRTIGIPDGQFCWQIIVLIVEFWLLCPVLNSSSINRQNFAKIGKVKKSPSSVDRDGKNNKGNFREGSRRMGQRGQR